MISCQNSEGQNYEIMIMLMVMKKKDGDMDMMEGGVEVKRLILARSRLPPEEVSGRVVSGRSSPLLLVISNIIVMTSTPQSPSMTLPNTGMPNF